MHFTGAKLISERGGKMTECARDLLKCAQSGDTAARDRLVEDNIPLVKSCIKRFLQSGVPFDDLYQIGCIGLMKAIDKFDLNYDVAFSTYAVPVILGEVKRFLRDDGMIKVGRGIKTLKQKAKAEENKFFKKQGHLPTISELAELLHISTEELIPALDAPTETTSLDVEQNEDGFTIMDTLSVDTTDLVMDKMFVKEILEKLPQREKSIVILRYFRGMTQTQIAKRLGISQVQVSRIEKKIFAEIREELLTNA